MTCGAGANPRRVFVCYFPTVSTAANVAEVASDASPLRSVTGLVPRERVGDLVQQRLVDLMFAVLHREISRNADALLCVVAQTRASFCVVEPKGPDTATEDRVEVRANERLGPRGHQRKLSHDRTPRPVVLGSAPQRRR